MAAASGKSRTVEERLQHLEDQLAIYQLMMTYGPCVDNPAPPTRPPSCGPLTANTTPAPKSCAVARRSAPWSWARSTSPSSTTGAPTSSARRS